MILFKVYHRKYTKDEPKLIGIERINDQGNWECNLLGREEWNTGVITIKEGQGFLSRKEFVTKDSEGEMLFEGDKFTVDGVDEIFSLSKRESIHPEFKDTNIRVVGYKLGYGFNKNYKIKLHNES